MSIEIEKKYKLQPIDYEQILAVLNQIDARYAGKNFEVNEIYGSGVLNDKKAVLRVRKIGEKTILTYKQRIKDDGVVKHQIEYETLVSDPEAIENIIKSLGFEKALVYEKRRMTWQLQEAEIVLDELPFGLYMEIEATVSEITKIETLLKAGNLETEHETYPALTAKHGNRLGETIEARFK